MDTKNIRNKKKIIGKTTSPSIRPTWQAVTGGAERPIKLFGKSQIYALLVYDVISVVDLPF